MTARSRCFYAEVFFLCAQRFLAADAIFARTAGLSERGLRVLPEPDFCCVAEPFFAHRARCAAAIFALVAAGSLTRARARRLFSPVIRVPADPLP